MTVPCAILLLASTLSAQTDQAPQRHASFTWGPIHPTRGLATDQTHLYATTKEGLKIITKPASGGGGEKAKTVTLALQGVPEPVVLLDENHLAVGTGLHVVIVNISDRSAPRLVAEVRIAEEELLGCSDLAVHGKTLYVAARRQGLLPMDVSNPADPKVLKCVALPGMATGIAIDHPVACVAVESGVAFVDIGRRKPKKLGYLDIFRSAWSIAARNRQAVLGAMNYIEVVDFSNPKKPRSLREGVGCTPYWYQGNRDLILRDHLLYAASGEAGLYIYDWTSVPQCRLLGQFGFWSSGATRESRIAYVKDFGIAKTDEESQRFIPEPFNRYIFGVAVAADEKFIYLLSHDGQVNYFRFTENPPTVEFLGILE